MRLEFYHSANILQIIFIKALIEYINVSRILKCQPHKKMSAMYLIVSYIYLADGWAPKFKSNFQMTTLTFFFAKTTQIA